MLALVSWATPAVPLALQRITDPQLTAQATTATAGDQKHNRAPIPPCGAPCRDPNREGPRFNGVEQGIITPIDDSEAVSKSHVETCPSLAELVPCVGDAAPDDVAPCSVCMPDDVPTTFYAEPETSPAAKKSSSVLELLDPLAALPRKKALKERLPKKPIYLVVAVPPFSGSSGLEGMLSTSSAVSTMCSKSIWQCEATSFLLDKGIFERTDRWKPQSNWTHIYEAYYKMIPGSVWDDPRKPILMDKSPPNIAKSRGMVEFFESRGMDYRFIVMARHPCMYNAMSATTFSAMAAYLREIVSVVPAEKRFMLSYVDFVTRPDLVAQDLLSWLPELGSLSIDKSFISFREARGDGTGRAPMPKPAEGGPFWSPFGTLTNEDTIMGSQKHTMREFSPSMMSLLGESSYDPNKLHGHNSTHNGRELPILDYTRKMCNLTVIKREYNTSDVIATSRSDLGQMKTSLGGRRVVLAQTRHAQLLHRHAMRVSEKKTLKSWRGLFFSGSNER